MVDALRREDRLSFEEEKRNSDRHKEENEFYGFEEDGHVVVVK